MRMVSRVNEYSIDGLMYMQQRKSPEETAGLVRGQAAGA